VIDFDRASGLDRGREAAMVRVNVLRGSGVVRRLTLHAAPGVNSVALRVLRPGVYRLVVVATNRAGNAACALSMRVRNR
jgi:hypothetical protein